MTKWGLLVWSFFGIAGVLTPLLLDGGAPPALAQAGNETDERDVISLARAFNAARNSHLLEATMAFFADTVEVQLGRNRLRGRDEVRPWLRTLYRHGFRVNVLEYRAKGQVVQWRARVGIDPIQRLDVWVEGEEQVTFHDSLVTTFVPVLENAAQERAIARATIVAHATARATRPRQAAIVRQSVESAPPTPESVRSSTLALPWYLPAGGLSTGLWLLPGVSAVLGFFFAWRHARNRANFVVRLRTMKRRLGRGRSYR